MSGLLNDDESSIKDLVYSSFAAHVLEYFPTIDSQSGYASYWNMWRNFKNNVGDRLINIYSEAIKLGFVGVNLLSTLVVICCQQDAPLVIPLRLPGFNVINRTLGINYR